MRPSRGFTLIETVLFIVVVSVGLTGVALVFIQTAGSSHEPLLREKALTVAKATMDEVRSRRWDENTPVGGGCVETASGSCTAYCASLDEAQCVASKCNLAAPNGCEPKGAVSGVVPGPEEAGRGAFDDIDDYDGLNVSPPEDDTGNPLPGYSKDYTVSVSVNQPVDPWNGIAAGDVRRIVVTVNYDGGRITLSSYRVNF